MSKVSPARKAAFSILKTMEKFGHSDTLLRGRNVEILSEPDRKLTTALVLGVLRGQIELDRRVQPLLKHPNAKLDAEVLIALWHDRLDAAYLPVTGADRFRSRFARFRFPGLPLELMGGLELHGPQGWQPVRVRETVRADCGGIAVPIPAPAEQVRLLQGFARPKDLQRAALLAAVHSPDR